MTSLFFLLTIPFEFDTNPAENKAKSMPFVGNSLIFRIFPLGKNFEENFSTAQNTIKWAKICPISHHLGKYFPIKKRKTNKSKTKCTLAQKQSFWGEIILDLEGPSRIERPTEEQ